MAQEAWKRVTANDAGIGEKAAALTVAGAMKTKIGLSKMGSGIKRLKCKKGKALKKKKKVGKKKYSFKTLVSKTMKSIREQNDKSENANDIIKSAIVVARKLKKESDIIEPRIIPIPKRGGILPLVPIFSGLSALGSLAGGVSSVINAIKSTTDGKRSMKRQENADTITVGKSKSGHGLYLHPYKKGYGLSFQPYPPTSISKNY